VIPGGYHGKIKNQSEHFEKCNVLKINKKFLSTLNFSKCPPFTEKENAF
jgi:hypothetical protein